MRLTPDPGSRRSAQALFDQGGEVGALARTLFPTGVEIGPANIQRRLEATRNELALHVPIFEAAFIAENAYAQVDIFVPAGKDDCDIVEVKSSTAVDEVHLNDVAFQLHVLTKVGLRIHRCSLAVVNNRYVRRGAVDPRQLFTMINVTDQVPVRSFAVGTRLAEMFDVTQSPVNPAKQIGPHCDNPYPTATSLPRHLHHSPGEWAITSIKELTRPPPP